MRPPPFNPEIRRALRIDVSAALLFAVFASVTTPFIGLILRRELGATPMQLAVMSAAGGACLLLSLLWARAFHGRPPLPYLVCRLLLEKKNNINHALRALPELFSALCTIMHITIH